MNMDALEGCGVLRTYKRKAFLCREDGPGGSAFIILKGRVSVVMNTFSDHPRVVAIVEAGGFTGEMSLFLNKNRSASLIAEEANTTALEIDRHHFQSFLVKDPPTCYKLLVTIVNRIDNMFDKLGAYDMRFVYEHKKSKDYVLAKSLEESRFNYLVSSQPLAAMKLIKGLCSLLDKLNERFLMH